VAWCDRSIDPLLHVDCLVLVCCLLGNNLGCLVLVPSCEAGVVPRMRYESRALSVLSRRREDSSGLFLKLSPAIIPCASNLNRMYCTSPELS